MSEGSVGVLRDATGFFRTSMCWWDGVEVCYLSKFFYFVGSQYGHKGPGGLPLLGQRGLHLIPWHRLRAQTLPGAGYGQGRMQDSPS